MCSVYVWREMDHNKGEKAKRPRSIRPRIFISTTTQLELTHILETEMRSLYSHKNTTTASFTASFNNSLMRLSFSVSSNANFQS